MTTAAPQAYPPKARTTTMTSESSLYKEIAEFMHSDFEKTGIVPNRERVLAETSAEHLKEVSRARQILEYRGELVGGTRHGKMVRPKKE